MFVFFSPFRPNPGALAMRQKYFLPISRLRNAANKCNDWGSWQGLDSGLLAVAKDLFNIPEGIGDFQPSCPNSRV